MGTWVHYATLHLPPEPNGFYGYNALQQIAYFRQCFVFGAARDPNWDRDVPGGGQHLSRVRAPFRRPAIRPLHSLPKMLGFVGFIVVHVALVVMTGFVRNMNHIVVGHRRLTA